MGITLQHRTTEKKRKALETMNQQYNQQTMDSQQFFELVEVPQQQYEYVNEMDSQGYSPSDTMSDQDYIPVEDYSAPPAKRSRTQHHQVTPLESRPGRAPKVSDDQLTATELERRNRRRARNREAAARQRNRRMAKVDQLENEVKQLTESNQSLVSQTDRLRAELEKLRFNMKLNNNQQPIKKAPKRQAPEPVKIEQCQPPIPDELFTPGGNFVLQTPAELKEQSFFPMETSKPEAELIKKEKEFIRQDSFSEYLNLL